jgi:putative flavoprotein involved in K+ transport
MKNINTLIIGGGQAGMATSYYLQQHRIEHIVLEQADEAAHAWRNERWDSFTLLTPNWTVQMPGAEYKGDNPDGFMPRDEIVAYLKQYAKQFNVPIQFGTRVLEVTPLSDGDGYLVKTEQDEFKAGSVVVATGMFQKPRIPAFSKNISPQVTTLHSTQYRNPQSLPPGAVLIVGSAQSGCQIAEDLYQNGRKVYLSVGSAGRAPRRYRGRDVFRWLWDMGYFEMTVDQLESPKEKFAANPQLSGNDGGRTINLHQFVRDGVQLLGRVTGADGNHVTFAGDLKESLKKVDGLEAEIVKMIDKFIAENGIDAPAESLPHLQDGYAVEEILELDLESAGIGTVIWAGGYTFDYSLVKLPVTDEDGYPLQKRGVTDYPGLYFVGMVLLHKQKSSILLGVGEDAEYIASHIAARQN